MEKEKDKQDYLRKLILVGDLGVCKFQGKSLESPSITFPSFSLTNNNQHKIIDFNLKVLLKNHFFSLWYLLSNSSK